MRMIVGVDLGGTNIVTGAVAADGSSIHGLQYADTPVREGPDAVIDLISRMVERTVAETRNELGREADILGLGIGSPGPLDTSRGVVITTPNLGWRNVPLRDRLAARTGLRATLDNDANCAVLGEYWLGAARGARIAIGLTIGTGIGGGIVIDGRLFHGASDVAGEFGHTTIALAGRRCNCGNYGCLEAYASGPAIAARAVESIEVGAESLLTEMVADDLTKITARTVNEAALQGDPLALEVVRDTARHLGAGIANFMNIFNPDVVVVSGGVTRAGENLFGPLRDEINRRAFKPAVDSCSVRPGELNEHAGVYGAAACFKTQIEGRL